MNGQWHASGNLETMDETALLGLEVQSDPRAQQRAWEYFEQLKVSNNGWELCANALNTGVYSTNDHVKFFCFQVVEFYLKERHVQAGPEDQQKLHAFLMGWLNVHCQDPSKDKTFICNKAAQMFALVFVVDFPNRWPSFFNDLLTVAGNHGAAAVWMYLRILMAIDTEVVDRDIAHTDPEYQRNTMLKDAMRDHSVPQMVNSWYHIIITYSQIDPTLTCFCLGVIGAYVAWIDITLIANDRFVTALLEFMNDGLLRESACECIIEIIMKGMEPVAKTNLIESFCTVLSANGIFNIIKEDDDDGDYFAKLSKLVNVIGQQLIQGWQKLSKSKDGENAAVTLAAMESKVPLMLKFLAMEDDDVSAAVAPFAHDYLTTLKQLCPLSEERKIFAKELFLIIIKKMTYDESYDFGHEGEEEAMFEEYRKELKVIFNNLGALDANLMLSTVRELSSQTFERWQSVPYQEAEIAVTLLYQLAEALPASHGQHFSGDPNKTSAVQDMLRLLITSKMSCYNHSSVQLQFFETVVRYDKFFNIEPDHVAEVLMAFLDERGLRNPSDHVRSRAAYLFSRFVKSINKQNLQPFLEEILSQVHDLLILNSPDNGRQKHYLSGDDQFFMYETAGILIVHSQFEPEKKQVLMKQLLAPIVNKFSGLLDSMLACQDEERQELYAQSLTQAMACASRTSKGFTAAQTMAACGCVDAYTNVLQLFLRALAAPMHRQLLHPAVRQFLHRMVVCLDQQILPFIPEAMQHLLARPDAKELHDFIPLINQVVSKFKKAIVPYLQTVFVDIVRTIFAVLNTVTDERDQVEITERRMLQRSYFAFIATLLNNDVAEVLSSQDSESLQQVLLTVIQGAVDIPDPTGQKTCYSILRKLVELWGGKDSELAGFVDYVYKHIVTACFMGPLKPTFDMSDAQTVLVVNECAMCLQTISVLRGDECDIYLQNKYLPTLNLSADLCQEFCQALHSDPKVFKPYFKSFFLRAKT